MLKKQLLYVTEMKSLRIEDDIHGKLTVLVGELTASSGRMQTYADAIERLLNTSIILPEDLIKKLNDLVNEGRLLGYRNHIEFVRDAVRSYMKEVLDEEFYVKVPIPRREYDILAKVLEKSAAPYGDPSDYLREHVREIAEEYEQAAKEKEG